MLWMGIWVHTYAVLHVQGGVNLRENGEWPSLYDVAVSWLRLQTPKDCIPQPYWMCTKCFSTLRCCGWSHTYAVLHVQVRVNFRGKGVWPSLYDVAVSWLRLQIPIDCIPHPYWMYTKCLNTLRCCGWAYDVVVSWLRLQTPKDCIPQPWHIYAKCFSTLRCCGWAYGYTLMIYYMCWCGWILGKMGNGRACMMLRCHGWGCKPPLAASHIHIGCMQSAWTPWDAVDGHMGTPLCL